MHIHTCTRTCICLHTNIEINVFINQNKILTPQTDQMKAFFFREKDFKEA